MIGIGGWKCDKKIVRMKNPVLDTYKEFRDFVLSTSLSGIILISCVIVIMAMFISTLVFENTDYEVASKLGIIAGSTIAGIAGLVVLSTTNQVQEDNFING